MKNKKPDNTIIARSPTTRYVCYNDLIGRGTYKIVYRGYDRYEGREVAWNSINFEHLSDAERDMIVNEIMLLKTLSPQNKYIINFCNAWLDEDKEHLIFVTGLALSGTLKQYISRVCINLRVIKKWGNQILQGINFLHQQHIAHRDLKCNNIFINSNTGDILIGDLGLAKKRNTNFHSVIGTPEFMAPEMYDEDKDGNTQYDEKIDIYAFGMCLIEMITKTVPYEECTGIGHVYKKVSAGIFPDALMKIKDESARAIIAKCISRNPADRPSATELIASDFFSKIVDSDNEDILNENDISNDATRIANEASLTNKRSREEIIRTLSCDTLPDMNSSLENSFNK